MPTLESLLEQIPIRQDFLSICILLGAVQGLIVSYILLRQKNRLNIAPVLLGLFVLCISLINLDIYLSYSGLMKYVLHLNNSTESLVLAIGPLMYLIVLSLIQKQNFQLKKNYFHFIPALAYLLYQCFYFFQPLAVKYNTYRGGYHLNLDYIPIDPYPNYDPLGFASEFRWLIIISFSIYLMLSFRAIYQQTKDQPFDWSIFGDGGKQHFYRNFVLFYSLLFVVILTTFILSDTDSGEPYIGLLISVSIYQISFFMMKSSQFFQRSWIADKYETSGLNTQETQLQEKLLDFMQTNDYHLQTEANLKGMAEQLKVAPNYLSQVVNSQLNKNFNDFINSYRIKAAQKRLLDPAFAHLSMEGIGHSVGFRSKSAFYGAFKKQTGLTPKAFMDQQKD